MALIYYGKKNKSKFPIKIGRKIINWINEKRVQKYFRKAKEFYSIKTKDKLENLIRLEKLIVSLWMTENKQKALEYYEKNPELLKRERGVFLVFDLVLKNKINEVFKEINNEQEIGLKKDADSIKIKITEVNKGGHKSNRIFKWKEQIVPINNNKTYLSPSILKKQKQNKNKNFW